MTSLKQQPAKLMALKPTAHVLAQDGNLLPKAPTNKVRHDGLAGDQFKHEYESFKIYKKLYTEFKTVYKSWNDAWTIYTSRKQKSTNEIWGKSSMSTCGLVFKTI